jgi:hypothetical protein
MSDFTAVMNQKIAAFFATASMQKVNEFLEKAKYGFYKDVRCPNEFTFEERGHFDLRASTPVPTNNTLIVDFSYAPSRVFETAGCGDFKLAA